MLASVVAVIVQVLVGIAIYVTGLWVHPVFWYPGLLAWILGFVLIGRWWSSHPGRVVAMPFVLTVAYYALAMIGDRTGLNGA
jgi:hypothetical protein